MQHRAGMASILPKDMPTVDDMKQVVSSFNFLGKKEKDILKRNAETSLAFSPALIESYNKHGKNLKFTSPQARHTHSKLTRTLGNSMSQVSLLSKKVNQGHSHY